jgi:hypothetical protein
MKRLRERMAHDEEADEQEVVHEKLGEDCDVAVAEVLGGHIEVVAEELGKHTAAGVEAVE